MVWVCVHNHADGIDVGVYESEDAANKGFANLIRRFFWTQVIEEAEAQEEIVVPEQAPEDDRKVVEIYNRVCNQAEGEDYASVTIEPHKVRSIEEIVNG